jgi:hypothetical protein
LRADHSVRHGVANRHDVRGEQSNESETGSAIQPPPPAGWTPVTDTVEVSDSARHASQPAQKKQVAAREMHMTMDVGDASAADLSDKPRWKRRRETAGYDLAAERSKVVVERPGLPTERDEDVVLT